MKTSEVCQIKEKKNKKNKELGASLVEYGLLIALVAVVAIPSVKIVGQKLHENFQTTADEVVGAGGVQSCNPFLQSC